MPGSPGRTERRAGLLQRTPAEHVACAVPPGCSWVIREALCRDSSWGCGPSRDSAGQRPQLLGPSAGVGLTAGVGGIARPALGLGSTVLGLTAGGAVSPGAGGAGAGAGAVLGATAAGAGAKSTGSVAAGAGGGGVTPGGRLPGGISVTGAAVPIGVPLLGAPITVPLIGAPTTGAPRPDRSRQRRQPGCQAFRGRLPRAGQSRGSCLACRPREWGQRRAPAGSI